MPVRRWTINASLAKDVHKEVHEIAHAIALAAASGDREKMPRLLENFDVKKELFFKKLEKVYRISDDTLFPAPT